MSIQFSGASTTELLTVIPELKGEVLTGEDGAPLVPEPTRREELFSTAETARRILAAVRAGKEAEKDLAEMDAPAPNLRRESQRLSGPEPEPEPTEAPAEPTEPPLPPHAYIYLLEGERERSGERCWLAMENPGQILRVFHGVDARQLARAWIGTKFGTSPCEEIEVPLEEEELE